MSPSPENVDINSPERFHEVARKIKGKPLLRDFYRQIYVRYAECKNRTPANGLCIEIGSGAGFVKDCDPAFISSDLIQYPNLDLIFDATKMPFGSSQIRLFAMINTFHHIPDVASFLREVQRCLQPGGRLLIIDQHAGFFSSPILKYFHGEPYRPEAEQWSFDSTGPLSGANGALASIVFQRDRHLLSEVVPELRLEYYRAHTPLQYWLAGGLKAWNLWPFQYTTPIRTVDNLLLHLSRDFGSFVDIEMVRC